MKPNFFQINRRLAFQLLGFGILYSITSLINHYLFRTYALDLGLYTNALFDYRTFSWYDSLAFKEVAENFLADHFDLYLLLLSPLSWIFGTYTLLIVQVAAILFGAVGVFLYFKDHSERFANWAALHFLVFYGIFSALSFDYHSNVVATMGVPWFFLFLKKDKLVASSLSLLAILIAKENLSLWLLFVCIGLLFEYKHDLKKLRYLAAVGMFCLAYFLIITGWVMPSLANDNSYAHFKYSLLGNDPLDAFLNLLKNPWDKLSIIFRNVPYHENGEYIKIEFLLFVFFSGFFFLLARPYYIIMLIPLFFQKLFHDNLQFWGINGHYSIEFAPILTIGTFNVIKKINHSKWKLALITVAILFSISVTIRRMDRTLLFTDKSRIRFYQKQHYTRNYDVHEVYEGLNTIPDNAKVSSQSPFLPHLALRDTIYQFPIIKDAEYIVYSSNELSYPLNELEFKKLTSQLENSDNWKIIYSSEVKILTRN